MIKGNYIGRRNFEWNIRPDFTHWEAEGHISQCILDKIYVGDEDVSRDIAALKERNITHIISVTGSTLKGGVYVTHTDFKYHRINGVRDSQDAKLSPHLAGAIEFLDGASGNVLIHCQAGISRSSSIAIACVMHMTGVSMEQAYDTVKAARSIIGPEPEFLFQIDEYFKCIPRNVSSSNETISMEQLLDRI